MYTKQTPPLLEGAIKPYVPLIDQCHFIVSTLTASSSNATFVCISQLLTLLHLFEGNVVTSFPDIYVGSTDVAVNGRSYNIDH